MEKTSALKKIKNDRKLVIGKSADKIVSPLAKYDSKGNLLCIICKSVIKSAAIWKVHINSKQHKTNVQEAKTLNKEVLDKTIQNTTNPNKSKVPTETPAISSKIVLPPKESKQTINTNKQILVNNKENSNSAGSANQEPSNLLPEMFFDDPVVDAKIRNVEYKNNQDEEWDKFQREIKEESIASNNIIFGEQLNSAVEREITEISEQIHHWSKVIDLENKLQQINKREKRNNDLEESDDEMSEDEIDDNLDWRSKKIA